MLHRLLDAGSKRCICMYCEYHSLSLSLISYDIAKCTMVRLTISTKISRITSYCTLSAFLPPIKGFIVELLDALIVAMDVDDALMVVRISMRLSIGSVSPPQTMVVNITIASVVEM